MALVILCPKPFQEDARRMRGQGDTDYEIALKYRIPEPVVPSLLSANYDRELARLLN